MNHSGFNLITILGHTAGGKTSVSAHLAFKLNGEIISADSRQVYRGMDIGTGKDYNDYMVSGVKIPFHLIDIVDAGYEYNLFEYQQNFADAYERVVEAGHLPILCGGSGLYIEAVIKNYKMLRVPLNQELRNRLDDKGMDELEALLKSYGSLHNISDTSSRKRMIRAIEIAEYQSAGTEESTLLPELNPLIVGINYNRETRRNRITERLRSRIEGGMIEEVERLLESGVQHEKLKYYGLEYKYVSHYLQGEINRAQLFNSLNTAIHQFAKRQMTYFRGMERRGLEIRWLDGDLTTEEKVGKIELWYNAI